MARFLKYKNTKMVNIVQISGLNLQKLDRSKTKTKLEKRPPGDFVVIPLKDGFGSSLIPEVEAGDRVKIGQIIARDDGGVSTPVHSSVSGTVLDVSFMKYVHEETLGELPDEIIGVKVEVDRSFWEVEEVEEVNWEKLAPSEIRSSLYRNGVTSFGQTGIPSGHWSSFYDPSDVSDIIVNAVKSEPFTHHRVDFEGELEEFKHGLEIIARGYSEAKIHLAVDPEVQEALGDLSSSQRISVRSFQSEHPNGIDKVLARKILGGDQLDDGGFLMDYGILALDEVVPIHAYGAVVLDHPVSTTRVSLGGPEISNVVVEVPVGLSAGELLDGAQGYKEEDQVILGGPLTGRVMSSPEIPLGKSIPSLVLMKGPERSEVLAWLKPGSKKESFSRAFISSLLPNLDRELDSGIHGELRPCISCGYCTEVCPVDILPYQIYHTGSHDLVDEVNRLQPQRCVDCGLCAYVCPSKLPLSRVLEDAKWNQSPRVKNYVVYEKGEDKIEPSLPEGPNDNRGEAS